MSTKVIGMGTNLFKVMDEAAAFAEHFSRRPLAAREFHVIMGSAGARQFQASLRSAVARERPSTVRIYCHLVYNQDTQARWKHIAKFRWYRLCDFVVLPSETPVEIAESGESIAIRVSREYLYVLDSIAEALVSGESDISFDLTNDIKIWTWRAGEGP